MSLVTHFFSAEDTQIRAKYLRLLCLLLLVLPVFFLGIFSELANPYLEFNREQVLSGQFWRLFTCNFVHLSSNHMFMNMSVYVLSVLIFGSALSLVAWHGALLICALAVGLGLLIFDSNVLVYVGLSGVIYGMILFGLLANIKQNTVIYVLVYVYISYKVMSQQSAAYNPEEMQVFIGGNVIASAHLMGLVAGNLCALVFWAISWRKRRVS